MSSRALEVNIAEHRVDVTIDPRYHVIKKVMSGYGGLQKLLDTFLKELCHPYKNRKFIVNEAGTYSLGYFYDLKTHPEGPEAARLYIDIAIDSIEKARETEIKTDAFHNLYALLQKSIKESGPELKRFLPVINYGFSRINKLSGEHLSLIARSYYRLNRLARAFLHEAPPETDFQAVNSLLIRYFEYTFSYWLSENDPHEWFGREISQPLQSEISALFKPISHSHIRACRTKLHEIVSLRDNNSRTTLEKLLCLPGYGEIVSLYKGLPDRLFESADNEKLKHQYKLIFLFHNMNIAGLSGIHEETLREVNRIISWLIAHEDIEHIQLLIQKTFTILRKSIEKFPGTVLKSVLNMGKGVYMTDESELVNFLGSFSFQVGKPTLLKSNLPVRR
ncbi:MAG TPA: hypothetical protein ENG83_03020 [Nitrospirae bacterium]|nr:hypothetical protein BMS3Abin06_01131 [bacterium BMS3Abin06]HDH11165.1 hypothetical protein [Nitrospirota bacterium]HDZ02644.1 hypothetical protein [Nitrospirota bacterium]